MSRMDDNDELIKKIEERFGVSFKELVDLVNVPCGDVVDLLWRDIVWARDPEYPDWEYPGQAYRHLLAEYTDLKKENERLKGLMSGRKIESEEELDEAIGYLEKMSDAIVDYESIHYPINREDS